MQFVRKSDGELRNWLKVLLPARYANRHHQQWTRSSDNEDSTAATTKSEDTTSRSSKSSSTSTFRRLINKYRSKVNVEETAVGEQTKPKALSLQDQPVEVTIPESRLNNGDTSIAGKRQQILVLDQMQEQPDQNGFNTRQCSIKRPNRVSFV